MSLNKNFTNPFLRSRTHNGKFGHAIQTTNQTNTANNSEDTIIPNILRSIHKSPFIKKMLYNAIGLTLMAATQGFAGDIKGVTGTTIKTKDATLEAAGDIQITSINGIHRNY